MIGNPTLPYNTDCIEEIIKKTQKLKSVYLNKLSFLFDTNSSLKNVAIDIWKELTGYQQLRDISDVIKKVTCHPKYDEITFDINQLRQIIELTLVEIGIAAKTSTSNPNHRQKKLILIKENIHLFDPCSTDKLHLNTFINKVKSEIGEDLCEKLLLEAKIETAQNYTFITQEDK